MKNSIIVFLAVLVVALGGYFLKVNFYSNPSSDSKDSGQVSVSPAPQNSQNPTPTQASASDNVLNLSGQGLTKAPISIFSQTNLTELNLSNNKIEGSLQAEVRQLQSLRVLNLSNNKFSGVPAEIGQLKNLEVLNLSNNLITGLPNELGNLKNLKLLDLSGNNYSVVDFENIKKSLPASVEIKTK